MSYDQATADEVIRLYAGGMLLANIEQLPGMPRSETIAEWRRRRPEFREAFEDARMRHAMAKEEEAEQIADTEADPQRARNRIDVRKWRAGVINPKVYGQKVDLNLQQTIDYRQAHIAGADRVRSICDQAATLLPQVIDGALVYAPGPTDQQSETPINAAVDPFS